MKRTSTAMLISTLLAGLFPTLLFTAAEARQKPSDAVLLSNVQTLTLRGHGARTSHRRVPSAPQLKCISHPSLCRLVENRLDVMRCENRGSSYDDADVEWSCSAILPEELRLGSTDVICEGYDSPQDPYVLKGSCGVEYRLALTDKGEMRYPDLVKSLEGRGGTGSTGSTDYSAQLFSIIFVGILIWIVWSAWTQGTANNNRQPRRAPRRGNGGGGGPGGGGGGGGGGFGGGWDPRFGGLGDDDDPPPPYPGRKSYQQEQQSWRPGFWTGLATGGAAGYAAGNRNRNRNSDYYADDGYRDSRRRNGESSSSASGSGPSGFSYEGTGFGSTSRR